MNRHDIAWAKPLAQAHRVVMRRLPHDAPEVYTVGGTMAVMPDGGWLASACWVSSTQGGDYGSRAMNDSVRLSRSYDGGDTWQALPPLPYLVGYPVVIGGALYLVLCGKGRRDILITRSDDSGETWRTPTLLFSGDYWNCPNGIVFHGGQLYMAFGTAGSSSGNPWNGIVAVACDVARDPLDAASWRMTPPLVYPSGDNPLNPGLNSATFAKDHWLEPNVVYVGGKLMVFARARIDGYSVTNIAGICDLTDHNGALSLAFNAFYPIPGAQQRFNIVYDEVSGYYWNAVNLATDPRNALGDVYRRIGMTHPGDERRILVLMYSLDALSWFSAGCVAMWETPAKAFHYAAPLIRGDDLLLFVRTSDDAPNYHDSEMMTLHTVRNFRQLAINLHPALS